MKSNGQCGDGKFSEFVLVLDESDSIDEQEWIDVKKFAKEIVKKVGISANGNRGAVVSFSDEAEARIRCNNHTDTNAFAHDIEKLERRGEFTNIEDGLIKGI